MENLCYGDSMEADNMLCAYVSPGEELGSIYRQNRVQVARVLCRQEWSRRTGVSPEVLRTLENGQVCPSCLTEAMRAIFMLPVTKSVLFNMCELATRACVMQVGQAGALQL